MNPGFRPKVSKIDGVNYVKMTIPSLDGEQELQGITVRALRLALEKADPDAMVTYIAEQNGGLLFGCIGGAAMGSRDFNVCMLFGPEAVNALKVLGGTEL